MIDPTDIRMIKEYYEQLYATKYGKLNIDTKTIQRHYKAEKTTDQYLS